MTEQPNFPTQERQPDPQPPGIAPAPSLLLYFVLVAISVVLIAIAFSIDKPDWPGLLINLASGLVGTVIILIFVDQRLRTSEIQAIQEYAVTTSVHLASIFSGETRTTISYAKVLRRQLGRIRPEPCLVRPPLEALFDKHAKGFILLGKSGSGKSTLIQAIAARQSENVLHRPHSELIPIFLRVTNWIEGNLPEQLWKEMCRYSRVKRQTFDQWLARGRALVILDAINEHWQPKVALNEIVEFQNQYPQTAFIISCRTESSKRLMALDDLKLPKIEMPSLTEEEVRKFLGMKLPVMKKS